MKTQLISIKQWQVSLILISLVSILQSCTSGSAKADSSSPIIAKRSIVEDIVWVDTLHIRKTTFQKELLSNGKLQAVHKSELRFRIAEMISSIEVKNGQRVKKGQTLATLESFEHENARDQAVQALEKSEIDMKDALISYGYNDKDSAQIPGHILKVAQTRSGYLTAKSDLKKALYDLTHTQLKAPFTGLIANLETHAYNQAETGKAFCLLIDDRKLEVSFSVLESDLADISLGQKIELTPFGKSTVFNGHISEINPLVDEHAMVKVKALVKNHNRSLISGMNAKVKIMQSIPNQIFIPKSALVLRQGKPVVFTWKEGQAHWNYVELGNENSTQINILSGLKESEIIIHSGNLNLAHKSPVSIQP